MPKLSQIACLGLAACLCLFRDSPHHSLHISTAFALVGYVVTDALIPVLSPLFIKVGLHGKDLSKRDTPLIPETIGAVLAIVYLFLMFFFIPFMFYKFLVTTSGSGTRDAVRVSASAATDLFPHVRLAEYLSAILCLESMVLLGIADDLFDIRWRNKFFLPAIAAIPLLIVYYIDFGVTSILVPKFLRPYFDNATSVDVGWVYYVYMASIAIFSPNSINILAGINGLEVGQSVVLAAVLLANDCCYLFSSQKPNAYDAHLFSAYLLLPFVGVSLALLKYNWFPARVFVGDTYCYFAGMVFAVVGILGHFSKTLLLFLMPQIFNFVYSAPQLFGIVPCPRHRMPKFNPDDGLMYPSYAEFAKADLKNSSKTVPSVVSRPVAVVLLILAKLRLLDVKYTDGKISGCNNLTLINLVLVWCGPLREDRLCAYLMGLLLVMGLASVVIRHTVGAWVFGFDNLWVNN
ncbi:hypothetical protein BABINDRAFT_41233 [Babjeviella inositovora NRRL Y-12698]|uniref:UDP-N-acetylglucosamine--dolichyl-phosphate N-acetylglucosaminephosphotransferase n=1 Tax=Babjeviella inositovora NRRL Y-12698 TaxID=984486 RepID=A0A1E3QIT7_9ASCO|nr:uncharacterized protein BABINDRAFT_41233 [Babjeviella inositovora NRRL Y-12698]ODQ77560.1 hypothetical protein BABINDRAFT_41233 [Babjeviella inositovora NRRL Y-12698]